MSKMSAVQAQLEQASGRNTPANADPKPAAARKPARQAAKAAAPAEAASYKAPSREGRVHVGGYLPADFKRSLMLVRAQTGQDVQTLLAQALNDLFRAHKVPVIDHD